MLTLSILAYLLLTWLACRAAQTTIEPWLIGMLTGWVGMVVGSLVWPDNSGRMFALE